MQKDFSYFIQRLKEKLWLRPLFFCLLSLALVFLAHWADGLPLEDKVPELERDSLKELLTTISASMLVIAIFAVGSMIAAYNAASTTATPRSFSLIIADDVSQNALSVYIGAFIYSVIATIALQNGYFEKTGQFALLLITLSVFGLVILTFLRWVQRISRLGRLNSSIEKIERAALTAIKQYQKDPYYAGQPFTLSPDSGYAVTANQNGYVQRINTKRLQAIAEKANAKMVVQSLPGTFATADKPLAIFIGHPGIADDQVVDEIRRSFTIGTDRLFDQDPRFALIALTEVASRALSPGINDPGTAIVIIGVHVRLFCYWNKCQKELTRPPAAYNRVFVPVIAEEDLFDDAFRPIARDGANNVEVMIRLQKAFRSIAANGTPKTVALALQKAREARERAEEAMEYKGDVEALQREAF